MAKPTGRRRASNEGRQEKKYRRQPYNYDFKLNVINNCATAGISATIARFFSSTDDGPRGSKRKLVSKWKQQRSHRAARGDSGNFGPSTQSWPRPRFHKSVETSTVEWINNFRRDGVPVSSPMLKIRALKEAKRLKIPLDVFSATWQWQSGFMKHHRFSFRVKTHTRQTASTDALEQETAFAHEVARRADVEGINTIYNAD